MTAILCALSVIVNLASTMPLLNDSTNSARLVIGKSKRIGKNEETNANCGECFELIPKIISSSKRYSVVDAMNNDHRSYKEVIPDVIPLRISPLPRESRIFKDYDENPEIEPKVALDKGGLFRTNAGVGDYGEYMEMKPGLKFDKSDLFLRDSGVVVDYDHNSDIKSKTTPGKSELLSTNERDEDYGEYMVMKPGFNFETNDLSSMDSETDEDYGDMEVDLEDPNRSHATYEAFLGGNLNHQERAKDDWKWTSSFVQDYEPLLVNEIRWFTDPEDDPSSLSYSSAKSSKRSRKRTLSNSISRIFGNCLIHCLDAVDRTGELCGGKS